MLPAPKKSEVILSPSVGKGASDPDKTALLHSNGTVNAQTSLKQNQTESRAMPLVGNCQVSVVGYTVSKF